MVSRNEASWPEGRAESDPAHDLNELALVLLRNPRAAADPHALDRAVALLRQAVDLTGSSGPARAGYLSNLANALRMRFERVGMVADLDLAIDAGTAAVQEAPSGPRSGLLSNLGNALLARYRRTGQEADLLSALTSHRQAIANSAPDDPNRHIYLSALGISLRSTFERERQPALIDESIDVSERAVACAPADDPQQPSFLCNLAVSLRLRFESTGDLPDLDRAVQSLEAALRATPSGDPQHIDFLGNLGSILCLRFDHIGNLADLDRAVQALREAVDATPASHPDRVMYLGNLANALRLRYLRHTDFRDIDEAVSAAREAVRLTPVDDPIRATYLSNLGLVLGERSRARTRETSHPTPDGDADLDAAVEAHRAAVEAASPGDPNRARYLSNLGTSFHQRAEAATSGGVHTRFLGKEDVDAAVDCQQRAVDTTGPDQVARARYLGLLGGALRLRYERTSSLPDLRRAGQAYQQAALTATAPPRLRVLAAAGWGAGAAQRLDWTTANQALGLAVELLSMVATERTGRDDQRYHLDHLSGLACDAAAAALNPGDVARALALLEQGRGILLARSIAVRGEVAQLRTRHPDLADRLEWLRQELDTEIDDPIAASSGSGDRTAAASDRRRQLAAAWDSVLSEIRQRPGLESFLRAPSVAQLLPAASEGPVVSVNVSRYRCDALVLTTAGVDAIPLPYLSRDDVISHALAVLEATTQRPAASKETLHAALRWMWDTIAGPVLDHVETTVTSSRRLTRLWWIPTGPLVLLPLHVAGYHHDGPHPVRRTVLDRVISSYAPTVGALLHAHRPAAPTSSGNALVIALPDTPAEPHLPSAECEAREVTHRLEAVYAAEVMRLTGPQVTRQDVRMQIARSNWLHFAGHAYTDLADPSHNGLTLYDGRLGVPEIATLRSDDAELAYLSACTTASGGLRLLDEALHICSAFQVAGYRNVVGTLWAVRDDIAALTAELVYTALSRMTPAEAVQFAVRQLRDAHPDQPYLWASYVHHGA